GLVAHGAASGNVQDLGLISVRPGSDPLGLESGGLGVVDVFGTLSGTGLLQGSNGTSTFNGSLYSTSSGFSAGSYFLVGAGGPGPSVPETSTLIMGAISTLVGLACYARRRTRRTS